MPNPYKSDRAPLTEEDAQRIVNVTNAFGELFDVLQRECHASRLLSVALTDLEKAHAMAIKSIHSEVLP